MVLVLGKEISACWQTAILIATLVATVATIGAAGKVVMISWAFRVATVDACWNQCDEGLCVIPRVTRLAQLIWRMLLGWVCRAVSQ